MLAGDRLVCALVDPVARGASFSVWPLHITVVPWFRVALTSAELERELQDRLQTVASFTVGVDGEAHFGHSGRKLVNLIRLPSAFTVIEQQIRRFLQRQGAWIVDETTKRSRPYQPHITVQTHERLATGTSFICDRLYLIEQEGDAKRVVGVMELGR